MRFPVPCHRGQPNPPRIQDLKGTSVVLTWDHVPDDRAVSIESTRLRSNNQWILVKRNVTKSLALLDGLEAGETYSFRVFTHDLDDLTSGVSEPSLPSQPLSVPLGDLAPSFPPHPRERRAPSAELDAVWQRDFERQYIELEELGRGRFAVVRRCQQILTGGEVAVKFVNRKRQTRAETQAEFEVASGLRHENVVAVLGLFVTSNSDAIVMAM